MVGRDILNNAAINEALLVIKKFEICVDRFTYLGSVISKDESS